MIVRWRRLVCGLLACLAMPGMSAEPAFSFGADPAAGDAQVASAIARLAEDVLAAGDTGTIEIPAASLAHLRIAAAQPAPAESAVRAMMRELEAGGDAGRAQRWVPYLLRTQAMRHAAGPRADAAYAKAFRDYFRALGDLPALQTQFWFVADPDRARDDLRQALAKALEDDRVSPAEAFDLARRQAFVDAYGDAMRLAAPLVREDEGRRYRIDEDVLIRTPQGVTLSAVVARPRAKKAPLPAAMLFTIYANPVDNRASALQSAARGYAGVVVDARGKRLSPDAIAPYEHEADDASAAVDWIAAQPWSDGRVAMHGGSYSGFAAWAAAKRMPAALKTIVAHVAAIPGLGVPMENNVFLNANYAWPFYVGNNRLLDEDTYFQRERWDALAEKWYASGRPYREIDRVDGTPNPWLQRWLSHPSYDAYWQAMVPQGDEYARIGIPVLSITGYYDDGQVSALHYFREHHRHNPDANHALLIGPYDHFGAQAAVKQRVLRDYEIDPAAQFDTVDLTYRWLDHVLRGAPRPELVRGTVNYQVMGANEWRHAPSLEAAAGGFTDFHLDSAASGSFHSLSPDAPSPESHLSQTVDLADRATQQDAHFPFPIVRPSLQVDSGLAFATEPFVQPVSVTGSLAGELKLRINKRDFDYNIALYELMADGRAMQLAYAIGRASHARDMATRRPLVPGEWTTLPIERTRMTSRRLAAGSRLVVVVDVLKDAFHEVNMGTGGVVADESAADGGTPLTVDWHSDSVIRLPLRTEP